MSAWRGGRGGSTLTLRVSTSGSVELLVGRNSATTSDSLDLAMAWARKAGYTSAVVEEPDGSRRTVGLVKSRWRR